MNDPDPSPINLDELRLLPDWLREEGPAPSKQYASHDYPTAERSGRGGRDNRSGGFGRDSRGPRSGSGGPPDRRRDDRRPGPPRQGGGGRPFREDRGPENRPPTAPAVPAPVNVEFLPDERCLVSINKQIRTTHLAYPLFGLARMFLQEPERHLVQFTLTPEAVTAGALLYQLGEDGPVTLDRATLEKTAFDSSKDRFYVEATVQKEPLKGNFTNVARCRLDGTLLGPTNYHAYQPALRSLYESRYSRRMSFEEFRHNIEVSTDPALVERWKEEARSATTISTREEPPTVLPGPAEARQHFRQHYLDGLLRTGTRLSVHGSVARKLPEPAMMQAIRYAHEQELRYPAQFVQLLRQGLQNAGLQIFKHRKRVVYVSLARPTPFVPHGAVSENVAAVLDTIAQSPLCTRKALAERVLAKSLGKTSEVPTPTEELAPTEAVPTTADDAASPSAEAPSPAPVETPAPTAAIPEDPLARAKAALAADLRFLVQSGHIIEFHNGTFDLPLPPKAKEEPAPSRPTTRKTTANEKPPEGNKLPLVADPLPSPDTPDDEESEVSPEEVVGGPTSLADDDIETPDRAGHTVVEDPPATQEEAESVDSARLADSSEAPSVESTVESDHKPADAAKTV